MPCVCEIEVEIVVLKLNTRTKWMILSTLALTGTIVVAPAALAQPAKAARKVSAKKTPARKSKAKKQTPKKVPLVKKVAPSARAHLVQMNQLQPQSQSQSQTQVATASTSSLKNSAGSPAPEITTTAAVQPAESPKPKTGYESGLTVYFYGPDVARWGAYQPDTATGEYDYTSPIQTENFLTFGYKFAENWSTGVGVPTLLNFSQDDKGKSFVLEEPYLYLKRGKVIDSGGLTLSLQANLYGAMSNASRNENDVGALRLVENFGYDIPGSRFSLGFYMYQHGYLIYEATTGSRQDYRAVFYPSVSYKITPTIAGSLAYANKVKHSVGDAQFKTNNSVSIIEPGMSFDLAPTVNLSPWVDFSVNHPVTADRTVVGLTFSWTLL